MNDETTQLQSDILDLERPGIIEASAGTGKTYSIAEIYLSLLCGHRCYAQNASDASDAGLNPNPPSVREILVVTFTEAATNELTDRLQKRIREALKEELSDDAPEAERNRHRLLRIADAEFDEAAISTIHGFCMRMLRDFSFECGLPSTLVPAENLSEEMLRFAARFRTREALTGNARIRELSAVNIKEIIEKLAKNPDIRIAEPDNGDRSEPHFHVATEGLKAWLAEREKIDRLSFDEVLLRLRDALRENPLLAKKIAARYRIALVDEFQDTDPVQWEIFKRIFVEQNLPFFCVGDPKQAIYEFRGGDIRTYTQARSEILEKSRGNRLRLSTNWRSDAGMIEAFNTLFRADSRIEPLAGISVGGNLDYSDAVPSPRAQAEDTADTPAIFLRTGFSGSVADAHLAVQKQLVDDIKTLVFRQKIPPEAIAVLTQKNSEAFAVLKELNREGVPAVMSATGSVLTSDEAHAARDILEGMLNPQHLSAVRRAASCEYFGKTFFEAIARPRENANDRIAELRETLFEAQKNWERKGILSAFALLEKKYSLSENLVKLTEASRRLANMRHVLEILQAEAHTRKLAPQALFKRFSEMLQAPNPDSEAEALRIDSDAPAVKITTMHKSKGLQYEIVFLPSLWEKHLNPQKRKNKPFYARQKSDDGTSTLLLKSNTAFENAAVEENAQTEACLTYVAFTRAKKACVVYHADHAVFGKKKEKIDSYLSGILAASGIFGGQTSTPPSPRWKVLSADEGFPPLAFKHDSDTKTRNPAPFLPSRNRPEKDFWGIFSFSKIIGGHETSIDENREPDAPETAAPPARESLEDDILQVPEYFSLAAGKEFGTLVHAIFEQVDFRSRNNLDALINAYRERFPQWLDDESSRRKFRKMFDETLELPIDGKSAKLSEIDSSRDALRELEFFFHAKKTENLYSELNDVFNAWGGIYKRTADFHWRNGNAGTLPVDGLMHGYIDLVARTGGRYYIADWKTNRITDKGATTLSRKALEDEIVACGYALQWAIYAVALRKYLRKTLGKTYSTRDHFGGIAYFFVRWNTAYYDDSLDDAKLDMLENCLTGKGEE